MDIKKILICIISGIVLIACGFFIGRETVDTGVKIVTEYIKGETIRDSIPYLVPYKVSEPVDTADIIKQCVKDGIYAELFPEKIVTEYIEVTKADTNKVMQDWASLRKYNEILFDSDTLGKCMIDAEVQYNRIRNMVYEFTPVIKTVNKTQYKVKTFTPFIGGGISTALSFDTTVGCFFNESWGVSIDGNYYFNDRTITNAPQWVIGIKLLKEF